MAVGVYPGVRHRLPASRCVPHLSLHTFPGNGRYHLASSGELYSASAALAGHPRGGPTGLPPPGSLSRPPHRGHPTRLPTPGSPSQGHPSRVTPQLLLTISRVVRRPEVGHPRPQTERRLPGVEHVGGAQMTVGARTAGWRPGAAGPDELGPCGPVRVPPAAARDVCFLRNQRTTPSYQATASPLPTARSSGVGQAIPVPGVPAGSCLPRRPPPAPVAARQGSAGPGRVRVPGALLGLREHSPVSKPLGTGSRCLGGQACQQVKEPFLLSGHGRRHLRGDPGLVGVRAQPWHPLPWTPGAKAVEPGRGPEPGLRVQGGLHSPREDSGSALLPRGLGGLHF